MMKRAVNILGLSATIIAIIFTGGTSVAENQSGESQLNQDKFEKSPLNHLRADKNWRKEKFTEKLNLTSLQQEQVENIRSEYHPQIRSLRENIRSERQKLAEMMKNNQSEDDLRSQHAKIMDLDQQIHSLRFDSMLAIREVLTEQQRQQWAELMQEHKSRHRGKFR